MEIQYNGATITIHRGTVRSRLGVQLILGNFADDLGTISSSDWVYLNIYARFLTQCAVVGDIGFPIPSIDSNPADIKAGLEAFLDADVDFYDTVVEAMNGMDSDRNAPELLPDVQKKGSPKTKDAAETSSG